jgi:GNAT superfamily N-acetyltransferase
MAWGKRPIIGPDFMLVMLRGWVYSSDTLPEALARKLPHYPVPAALLGRLAVNKANQGQGLGSMLLADAIKRTLSVSEDITIYAMVVDSIDKRAQRFYEQFGFSSLSSGSRRLYLQLKSF